MTPLFSLLSRTAAVADRRYSRFQSPVTFQTHPKARTALRIPYSALA
jgi:hypothetical protein